MRTGKISYPNTVQSFSCMLEIIRPQFESLAEKYRDAWGLKCTLTDMDGNMVADIDSHSLDCATTPDCTSLRKKAIQEALRWGEPSMLLCPKGFVIWAVPVMFNSAPVGGAVVEKVEAGDADSEFSPAWIRRAANNLLTLAEDANITNASLLQLKRTTARRESERAEAIHELKEESYQSIRDIYLLEEPSLITAIKQGDRRRAREILNRVLVGIYYFGRKRPKLLKSFLLELIATMSRSAVEAGADPYDLLGANYSTFAELARIDTEEDLCAWLVSMLERMMDAIKSNHQYSSSVLLSTALKYMKDNLSEELSRDQVADVACLSPSHFSRIVKGTFGRSFTEMLANMRVEKARELLTCTEKSLMQIGLECGFNDQSYFTKIFRKCTGQTPSEYRKSHRAPF